MDEYNKITLKEIIDHCVSEIIKQIDEYLDQKFNELKLEISKIGLERKNEE